MDERENVNAGSQFRCFVGGVVFEKVDDRGRYDYFLCSQKSNDRPGTKISIPTEGSSSKFFTI